MDYKMMPNDGDYLWNFRCDGHSEEVHGQIHASHHENKQAMARVAVGTQAFLEKDKERTKTLKPGSQAFLYNILR